MQGSRKPGKPEQRPLLFICQDSVTLRRENLRAIVSHARKTQTKQKHSRKRASAQRDATYARSLVGWQQDRTGERKDGTSQPKSCSSSCQVDSSYEHGADQGRETYVTEISPSLGMRRMGSDGLRIDPFSSFPLNNTEEVARMIDFCTSLELAPNKALRTNHILQTYMFIPFTKAVLSTTSLAQIRRWIYA